MLEILMETMTTGCGKFLILGSDYGRNLSYKQQHIQSLRT
jgi:hypothetical protein